MSIRDIEKEIFILKLRMTHDIKPDSNEYVDAVKALILLQDMHIQALKNQLNKEIKYVA